MFWLLQTFGQYDSFNQERLVDFTLNCHNTTILKIPEGYIWTDTSRYVEGHIVTVIYPDSSYISILCGANAELNLPSEQIKELYYRKKKFKGITILYQRVTPIRKKTFDKFFASLPEK
jgi:hypothetical protein